ncbi:uncharacterized protein LOC114365859 [Ostrinia furnacalis]|uniref:uncharacterized protein LOC114365859 n=1 Tax=Ostrinia furnacalis TaxID=93504 RepID=UPI0010391B17|nr:uncharacterized protein LOC114365859 [Ostrinia furnacalis]
MSGQSLEPSQDIGQAALAKDWSCDSNICHASTSRGHPSRSSGDYDGTDSYSYCSVCSCESEHLPGGFERPCLIVDSTTKIHKSKWTSLINYFKRHFKAKRKGNKTNKIKENR